MGPSDKTKPQLGMFKPWLERESEKKLVSHMRPDPSTRVKV